MVLGSGGVPGGGLGRGLPARKEAVMMPSADAVRRRGRRSVILFFCGGV